MSPHDLQAQTECPKCESGQLVDQTPIGLPADVDNGCMCQQCNFKSSQPMGSLAEEYIDVSTIDCIDSDVIHISDDEFNEDADPHPTYIVSNGSNEEQFTLLLTEQSKPATGTDPKYKPFARQYPA
jgi:predicted HNH restriction endonuclease